MYLNKQIVKYLNTLKGGKYLDNSVNQIGLNNITSFKKADYIIAHQINNFVKDKIITNTGNKYPKSYKKIMLDKLNSVALYEGKPENLFCNHAGNYELNLYEIKRKQKNIEELFNTKFNKLLIVGSGHSWQNLNYNNIPKDIEIMVINYNFKINANWNIYHDKRVGEDLKAVKFKDNRKIIGEETQGYGDYLYKSKFKHTGAEALYLAQKMGYEKIYLIGFDYCPNNKGKFHTYDCKNHYTDAKIKMFLDDFNKLNYDNVFNLNHKSKLRKYKFIKQEELHAT